MPTPLAILSGKKDEAELASIGKASKYSKMSILLRHKDIISRKRFYNNVCKSAIFQSMSCLKPHKSFNKI